MQTCYEGIDSLNTLVVKTNDRRHYVEFIIDDNIHDALEIRLTKGNVEQLIAQLTSWKEWTLWWCNAPSNSQQLT